MILRTVFAPKRRFSRHARYSLISGISQLPSAPTSYNMTTNANEHVTPRVNKTLLVNHIGRTVRLVGKIISHDNHSRIAILETSDNGQVHVQMNPMSSYNSLFVEVIGKVNDDLSLKELTFTDFGNNFSKYRWSRLFGVRKCSLCSHCRAVRRWYSIIML
jgi:replication factor A3